MKPLPKNARRGIMHGPQAQTVIQTVIVPAIAFLWFVVVIGEYLLKRKK